MYDVLLYVGDLNFSLRVAELIYTKVKLDDNEFINSQACSYYSNKKNMIVCELLETIFQVYLSILGFQQKQVQSQRISDHSLREIHQNRRETGLVCNDDGPDRR